MKKPFGLALWLLTLSLFLATGKARAQVAEGFNLDRFRPSERGQDWFAADSLDLRGSGRVGLGVVANWSHKPLVIYDAASGDELGAVVRNQWLGHVYVNLTVAERLRLSANLPLLLHQDGNPTVIGGDEVSADSSLAGDLRLGATLGLLGAYRAPFSLAVGVQANLPTGSQHSFTSDGSASLLPRLMLAGDVSLFTYAAEAGVRIGKSRSGWFNETTGNDMIFTAAAGVRATRDLTIGPELWGTTVVGSERFLSRTGTPLELLLGGHYQVADFQLGLGMGWGLTRGYGAPQLRTVLGIAWAPAPQSEPVAAPPAPTPPPEPDSDGDGIIDREDACPKEPGVRTDDPKTNGCPSDGDHDGVPDAVDACPQVPGDPSNDPKLNGCPSDRDRDGIVDSADACPDEAGEPSDDPKTNGCPKPKDRDGDGILDPEDACPDAPGPRSDQPQANGCPLARIDSTQIVILEAVRFAYNSDRILPASEEVLKAVLDVLTTHQEIEALEVHGHTDDKGAAAYNLGLSKRRAASVAKWLVSHGLQKNRITSFGFGKTRPILPNDSEENRERNRRVEFHIVPPKDGGR